MSDLHFLCLGRPTFQNFWLCTPCAENLAFLHASTKIVDLPHTKTKSFRRMSSFAGLRRVKFHIPVRSLSLSPNSLSKKKKARKD